MAETKAQKLLRIASGSVSQQPIPEWPRLPEILYKRHPEDKEALDKYHADCIEFFKKSGNRAQ